MWQCPICGRQFAREGQNHFCEKPQTIDQYIALQPRALQPLLRKIRQTVRTAAPQAQERMSWQMPTFWQGENLIHFAAFQKHIGLYPGGEATQVFADRLTGYHTAKGTVRLPLDQPVPLALIADITRWRVEQAAARGKRKANPAQGAQPEEDAAQGERVYRYRAVIQSADRGGAYLSFPWDLRAEFGKGRLRVEATFDGHPYRGSVVNMGVHNADGSVCYIIGIKKDIRAAIGKQPGDTVEVTVRALETGENG